MTNLTILQHVCDSVNISYPTSLASLNWEQTRILCAIDDAYRRIARERDWPWVQDVAWFPTTPVSTGTWAVVLHSDIWYVDVHGETPFVAGVSGKMTLDDLSEYADVAFDVTGLTATTAQITSTWVRGSIETPASWAYGVCDYLIPDADRVAHLVDSNFSSAAISRILLEESDVPEIEDLRASRPAYIMAWQPERFAEILRVGGVAKYRLDPFPIAAGAIQGFTFKTPVSLVAETSVTPDLPAEWHEILVDEGIAHYYRTFGINKNAGPEAQFRLSALDSDRNLVLGWARQQCCQATAESASFSPRDVDSYFWADQYGRNC